MSINTKQAMAELADAELNKMANICRMGHDLSVESLDMPFISAIGAKFTEYVGRIAIMLNGLKVGNYKHNPIDFSVAVAQFNQAPYVTNRMIALHTAPGFNGKWVPFLEYIEGQLLPNLETLEPTLKRAITRLAQILNQPDRLAAQSGIKELAHGLPLTSPQTLEKITTFFKDGAGSTVQASQVIDRNGDLGAAFRLGNEIDKRLAAVDFTNLDKQVDRFKELTQSFAEYVKQDGSGDISGKVGSQLSELFYLLGTTVSSASVVLEVFPQHNLAMHQNVDAITKQVKAA